MAKWIPTAAGVLLAACDGTAGIGAGSIEDRLRAGDATICADKDVQQTLLSVIAGEETFKKFADKGGSVPPFTVVSATGMNKDIAEVTCSGKAKVGDELDAPLEWKVRPALDAGGGFIVESLPTPGRILVQGQLAYEANKEPEQAREAEPAAQQPAPDLPADESADMNADTDMNATTTYDDESANAD